MKHTWRGTNLLLSAVMVVSALLVGSAIYVPVIHAGNEVMGELQFEGKTKIDRTSGVWIDGGYVGYLKELKGSKKVLLLPGDHLVSVRQDGYQDYTEHVVVAPGQKYVVNVVMSKAATPPMPSVTATVKIAVNPNRAAVFVDGQFVGHVGEFEGAGRGMLVAPGSHNIKVALPGYQTFETQIDAQANQKVEVKTDLVKNDAAVQDPTLKSEGSATPVAAPPPPPDRAVPPQR